MVMWVWLDLRLCYTILRNHKQTNRTISYLTATLCDSINLLRSMHDNIIQSFTQNLLPPYFILHMQPTMPSPFQRYWYFNNTHRLYWDDTVLHAISYYAAYYTTATVVVILLWIILFSTKWRERKLQSIQVKLQVFFI